MRGKNAVLLIADDRQFPPAVFLASRLAALRSDRDIDIVLASDSTRHLGEAGTLGGGFRLIDLNGLHRDLDLPPAGHLTRSTYYSLFVPTLLERQYDRLLYLDADTYPESAALFALFDLDMGSQAVAAVRDLHVPFIPNMDNGAELIDTLGIAPDERMGAKYLNSGVLLIDFETYRRQRIAKTALQLVRQKTIKFRLADQTIFNAVLRMRWLELSPSFNMVTRAWASFIRDFAPPVVVHFSGDTKPWHSRFVDDHPVRRELADFLKATPWPQYIREMNPPPRLVGGAPLPPPPQPQLPLWEAEFLDSLVQHLRETPFADVEQGLTKLNHAALPTEPAAKVPGRRPRW